MLMMPQNHSIAENFIGVFQAMLLIPQNHSIAEKSVPTAQTEPIQSRTRFNGHVLTTRSGVNQPRCALATPHSIRRSSDG